MFFKLALFCLLSLASASDVLDLTDANFGSKCGPLDLVLVEFFAPWCGHCKKLAPEYEKAATVLKGNDPPVVLAKVDCTENTEICGKYGVSGYPTLKIFRGGEMTEDYNGPREADGIVKTMKGKAGPASKELKSVADAEKFLSNFDHGCVAYLSSEDSELGKVFKKTADGMNEEMRFAHTTSKEVKEKYGMADDTLMFHMAQRLQSKFEAKETKYEGEVSMVKIKSWIKENKVGLCPHRTLDNAGDLPKPTVVAFYDVDYVKNIKGTNYWRNRVMKVAQKFKDADKTVQFAVSGANEFGQELSEFGIENPESGKVVVAGRNAKGQKFVMSEDFSMDNLEKFTNDLLDNKLEPHMKSEPIPASQDAVKVLVAKNFDDIVVDDKDVLIEFYAPWCGHCKSLEPKYKELAEKLEDEPSVVIAKMDATANDVPSQFEVQGFPTIFYKPKEGSPKKYQGGREVDDFVKYLAKESTDGLENYNRNGKKKKSKKTEL